MSFLKNLLASVALIAAATTAHADIVDLGNLVDPADVIKTVNANTTFVDTYNFSLNVPSAEFSVSKIVLTNTSGDRFNFSSLTFSVYSGVFGDNVADTLLNSVSVPTVQQVDFVLGNLVAGNYYVQVAGKTSGAKGGSYSFNITPVPEPTSAAMLLVGFAALGAVARRRKSL